MLTSKSRICWWDGLTAPLTQHALMSKQSLERLKSEITSIGMAHPFDVHGVLFRILSIEDAPPPAHLTGWKDTVLVEDKAELLVTFNQPATREHPFMYHCHILEHEDAGLMGQYVCAY